MKLVGVISTAVLSLTLGIAAPAYAQQEQHDQQEEQKAKPDQNEKAAQPAKPAEQKDRAAKQEEKNTKPEEQNARQNDNNTKPENNAKQEDKNVKPAEKNAQPEQRAAGSRGGQIPADKFKAHFGQQHSFRVSQSDYSNHSFQYGGYSFGFVDSWPSNWLYTQSVYVIEINGVYYLCNASFPGVNLELSFAL
jgi:hypothetical protein